MADYFGAAGDLFSGVMNGFGDFAEAAGSRKAAALYGQAASYAKTEGGLKDLMLKRQAFQTIGGAMADVGSGGFKMAGSALEIMRSNAQQASLSRAITDLNTRIQVNSFTAQEEAAKAAAASQTDQGIGSIIGGIFGAAGAAGF